MYVHVCMFVCTVPSPSNYKSILYEVNNRSFKVDSTKFSLPIHMTIGGATNILLSRKHFAMSLNMQNPRLNLRAYYGLIMACKAFSELSAKQKSSNRYIYY